MANSYVLSDDSDDAHVTRKGSDTHGEHASQSDFSRSSRGIYDHDNSEPGQVSSRADSRAEKTGIGDDIMGADGKSVENIDERSLTQDERKELLQIRQIAAEMHYSGPIPPASEILKYKEVSPDFPDRVLSMTERQQEANISIAHRMSKAQALSTVITVLLSWLIPLISISLGLLLHANLGVWIGAVCALPTVAVQLIRAFQGGDKDATDKNE